MNYQKIVEVYLPTKYGEFQLAAYQNGSLNIHHLALIKGDVMSKTGVPVRIHSSCVTGDILGSLRCDCGIQLTKALKYISKKPLGVILYLFQEGRGIGLVNKLKAYSLQENGLDTVEANLALNLPIDARKYNAASDILKDLGVKSIHLLTNNPQKVAELTRCGVKIDKIVPMAVKPSPYNLKYLLTQREKMGHFITI